MIKIIRYTFFDLIRSSWTYFYLGFYLILSSILLFLNHDHSYSFDFYYFWDHVLL